MKWPGRRGDRDAFGDSAPEVAPRGDEDVEALGEPRIVGVLLAAGAATRFGSPKQLAILDDRTLVETALAALLAAGYVDEVVVVVGAQADAVEAAVASSGWDDLAVSVRCPGFAEGLSASLRCGVAAAEGRGADAVVVHLADLPLVGTEAVDALLDHAVDDLGDIVDAPTRATYAGRDGHPVVFPRSWFERLVGLTGDTGARELLAGPHTRRIELGHLAEDTDIDTPDQLEALQP